MKWWFKKKNQQLPWKTTRKIFQDEKTLESPESQKVGSQGQNLIRKPQLKCT